MGGAVVRQAPTVLEDLGNLGDFLGGLAVVATLAYLALQIRQNTRATQVASHEQWVATSSLEKLALVQDEKLCSIYLRGCADLGSLSPEEGVRFRAYLLQVFNTFEALYFQTRNRAVDEIFLESKLPAYQAILSQPGGRAWWKETQSIYDPRFREFVGRRIAPPAV